MLAAAGSSAAAKTPLAPPNNQSADAKEPTVAKKKLGFAVVGLGKLAMEEVMPAFQSCTYAECVALVSGHPAKAKRVAAAYGISPDAIYGYDDYDKLKANAKVEAVYIILPNSMHADHTVKALQAGKHVLCEKPMATSIAECERMIAAAKTAKKQLAIAYRLQYEPHHLRAIEICKKQELGALKLIEATNCQDTQAPNIRLSKTLGGGPLGDVGIYCINAARYLTGEEPVEVTGFIQQPTSDPRFAEVPESVSFQLRFPSGVIMNGSCSFGSGDSRLLRVTTAKGYLHMDNAFAYRGIELRMRKPGKAGDVVEPGIEAVDHFTAELDGVAKALLDNKPVKTPGADGLADMKVIKAIEEAAASGKVVKL